MILSLVIQYTKSNFYRSLALIGDVLIVLFLLAICFSVKANASSLPEFAYVESETQRVLDLQDNQISNVNAVLYKWYLARLEYPAQAQYINEEETQDLEQYLLPYQISEWRTLQAQLYPINGAYNNDDYSNLPYATGDMVDDAQ